MQWDELPYADIWVFTETGHLKYDDLDFLKDKGFDKYEEHREGAQRHGGVIIAIRKEDSEDTRSKKAGK